MARKYEELRGRKVKADYQHDDFYQIRILMYLTSHTKARISDFSKKGEYMITSNKQKLGRILGEMIEDKWISRTILDDAKNVKIYTLAEKGHQMKDFILKLRKDEETHPLFDCDLFSGIKSLG
ncbi:MAG: hypothetical protein HOD60_12510 [Candidatus Nitrosopelagicus sp.]|nr:hypothetical protein [Candidatus Nitrosopelagicus sp.]